jgi:diguanylate cyclase (GGDEF)-like protein
MDIDIIIKKGLVYSMITGVLAGFYMAMIFIGQETIRLASLGRAYRIIETAIAVIVIAIVFEPLRNYLQKFVDKRFFKTHYDYQEAIKEFSRMVVTILDLDQLLHRTARTIKERLHLDQVVVLLHNPEEKLYEVAAFDGGDESIVAGLSFTEDSKLVKQLASENARVILDFDADADNAVISLKIKNELMGFLLLGAKLSGDVYTPADKDLLTTLADQLSIAVENARLYRAAVTDKLSKLFNGTYFYDRLEDELVRSKQQKTSLGVLMLDIDGLSAIIVNEGADVADYIISAIGKTIRSEIRQFDVAARVGDDEFAIILPGIKKDELHFWESTITESISRIKVNGEVGLASVSIGTAYVESGLKGSRRLMNDAQRSLLQAKSRKAASGSYS